jgi:surface antigen
MAVVVSSSMLVTATNVAADRGTGSLLSGYWDREAESSQFRKNMGNGLSERGKELAFVPLIKPSSAVNPNLPPEAQEERVEKNERYGLVYSSNVSLKDPEENGGVKIYEVQSGDTIGSIALTNHITVNTILWANDIDNVDSIKPGDKIFILPVPGLKHVVGRGDTIDTIATKYKADKEKIISFNDLPADGALEEGKEIIIPGGQKEIARTESTSLLARRQYSNTSGGTPTVSGWRKLEGKAGTGHRFPYGYCTWYVAQRRFVPWSGNAGTWLYNAKAMGYKTGKTPAVGAIMVSSESWWGHVAIVEKVNGDMITISEMNYKGWAKKSSRTLSAKSRVIKGFIY